MLRTCQGMQLQYQYLISGLDDDLALRSLTFSNSVPSRLLGTRNLT